jgi:dTDP-glucose 4,6-dehydratase
MTSAGGAGVANPLLADLSHVLAHTHGLWDELRGQRLFLTGGTGFFGCWLLESFLHANDCLNLGASAVVLTRSPEAFARRTPHLARHPAIALHEGDVRSFVFPEGRFTHLIHGATDTSTTAALNDPLALLETIVGGTQRTLEFARRAGVKKLLLLSSGAVYGRQSPELSHLPEDHCGAPDPTDWRSAYGNGKRLAEQLATLYHRQHRLEAKIARCFTFLGPYQPLDSHFAVGNFIRDGLRGGPIRIHGDGTAFRSYLHAADLAAWLWAILLRGVPCRPYNVGSEEAVSIVGLARRVAGHFHADVVVDRSAPPGQPGERYVPSARRAAEELGLQAWLSLDEALVRTVAWHRRPAAATLN